MGISTSLTLLPLIAQVTPTPALCLSCSVASSMSTSMTPKVKPPWNTLPRQASPRKPLPLTSSDLIVYDPVSHFFTRLGAKPGSALVSADAMGLASPGWVPGKRSVIAGGLPAGLLSSWLWFTAALQTQKVGCGADPG